MNDNKFFKPTALYKEYMILDMIEKNPNITQREMSHAIGIAVSMVNDYLDDYEKKGYIKRKKYSSKNVEYFVTKKGSERRKVLNIGYLNATKNMYFQSKENFEKFLALIKEKGYNKILLYGAGEVAEMIIHTIMTSRTNQVNIMAVVDDDPKKQGHYLASARIIKFSEIHLYDFDGILVSSYNSSDIINKKMLLNGVEKRKIIRFFD